MAPFGSSTTLCQSSSFVFFSRTQKSSFKSWIPRKPILKISATASFSGTDRGELVREVRTVKTTSFGFKNLTETFWVDVQRAEETPLKVKLQSEALNGSSRGLENVAIRVELSNGCVGWGEAAESATAEALAKAKEACEFLRRSSPLTLNLVLEEIGSILHGKEYASVSVSI